MGSMARSLGRFLLSQGYKRHPHSAMWWAHQGIGNLSLDQAALSCSAGSGPLPSASQIILYRSVKVETHIIEDTASLRGVRRLGEHSSSAIRRAGEGRGHFCHSEPQLLICKLHEC